MAEFGDFAPDVGELGAVKDDVIAVFNSFAPRAALWVLVVVNTMLEGVKVVVAGSQAV